MSMDQLIKQWRTYAKWVPSAVTIDTLLVYGKELSDGGGGQFTGGYYEVLFYYNNTFYKIVHDKTDTVFEYPDTKEFVDAYPEYHQD